MEREADEDDSIRLSRIILRRRNVMANRARLVGIAFILIGLANLVAFRRSTPGLGAGVVFLIIGSVLLVKGRGHNSNL
jgi:uncharacterized membrane protein YkgB